MTRVAVPNEITTIRIDDFVEAILAGLALNGPRRLDLRADSLYAAFEKAYVALEEHASPNVRLWFSVFLDRLHASSPDIRQSLARAADRGLVSLSNPDYVHLYVNLSPPDAERYLQRLPGGPDTYRSAIEAFRAAI
jgi:hypothetical protein